MPSTTAVSTEPTHLARARSELRVLQQMLGLHSNEQFDPRLRDVVFVCIDCEAFEFGQDKITEIGVAILDTRDLADITTEKDEKNWLATMKYAHYRPLQYAKFRNKRWSKAARTDSIMAPLTGSTKEMLQKS